MLISGLGTDQSLAWLIATAEAAVLCAHLLPRHGVITPSTADAAIDLVQKNVETQSTGSQHSFEHGVLVADLLKGRPGPRSGSAF